MTHTDKSADSALIVTGMPWSGYHMVGQALFDAGLFLGGTLSPPDANGYVQLSGNKPDTGVSNLHKTVLERHGAGGMDPPTLQPLEMPADFRDEACRRLDAVHRRSSPWGWCDRYSALFIKPWNEIMPTARWLFAICDPAVLVQRCLSEGVHRIVCTNPVARTRLALQLWAFYSREMLALVEAAPDRTCLLLFPAAASPAAADSLRDHMRSRWNYNLGAIDIAGECRKNPLSLYVATWIRIMTRLDRAVGNLWRRARTLSLEQDARPAPRVSSRRHRDNTTRSQGKAGTRIALITQLRNVYSETFIRNHMEWLPADVHFFHLRKPPAAMLDNRGVLSLPRRVATAVLESAEVDTTLSGSRAFGRYLKRHRFDCMLAEFGPVGVQVMDACRLAGIPLVVHFHGFDAYRQPIIERYGDRYREMFAYASAIVVVSRDMYARLLALGAPEEKLHFNPCGVDLHDFRGAAPAKAPPHFLAVGRFVDKKAPYLLLHAFARAYAQCPNIRLTMVGDGVLLPACKEIVRLLKIDARVDFPGVRPPREIAARMRLVRGMIQHSITASDGDSEGTPVSVMEAGASGLPVIATRHGGIVDAVIDGKTGILVAEGDVDGMAEAIVELAENPERSETYGKEARKHIRAHYSKDHVSGRLWEIVARAMK